MDMSRADILLNEIFRKQLKKAWASAAIGALLAVAMGPTTAEAQQIVPANPNAAYQKGKHGKVKHVLLYDYSCKSHSKTPILNSLTRLANQYGFRLDRGQTDGYITPASLQGVDVVVLSNGDCDVLENAASLDAMRTFVEVQGKGILHSHAAAAGLTCPNEKNLADPDCRWQMKTLTTQFLAHFPFPTSARIYADSVKKGEVPPRATGANAAPSAENHGRSNPETRMIFESKSHPLPANGGNGATANQRHVWDGLGCEWYTYRSNPRLQGPQSFGGVPFGPLNILLSLDETSVTTTTCCRMGDRPVSWTRKVGNGNAAYQNAGHSDIYRQARKVGGANVDDGIIEKYNWNLIRYLARDFAGCMDDRFAEYNPEASVTVLNPGLDDPAPCKTPVSLARNAMRAAPAISAGSAIRISLTDPVDHRILVLDMNGKSVYAESAKGPKRLVIPDLQNGTYVVKLGSSAGDVVQRVEVGAD